MSDSDLEDSGFGSAIHDHNRRAWDARVRHRDRFTQPARDEELHDPLRIVDGVRWLGGNIQGWQVLCLAAGGGRHSAMYAAAGANVTVVDLSGAMLQLDRAVAAERHLNIRTVQASMDHLPMFHEAEFDAVIHPVSTCYVPDVQKVYAEIARIVAAGGLYISQHKQPTSLQADIVPSPRGYELIEAYYREGPLPNVAGSLHREEGTLEFLHRWEQLLGEMCRAGFVIEDLIEPRHADPQAVPGTFRHRSIYLPPYVRVKARRSGSRNKSTTAPNLWLPRES